MSADTTTLATPIKTTLHVVWWSDTAVEAVGHDPRSQYAERFWLPIVGPSTLWLARRLVTELESSPGGFDIEADDLTRSLGLVSYTSLAKTIKRLCDWNFARAEFDRLAVRRQVRPLARHQVMRLPARLVLEHEAWEMQLAGGS